MGTGKVQRAAQVQTSGLWYFKTPSILIPAGITALRHTEFHLFMSELNMDYCFKWNKQQSLVLSPVNLILSLMSLRSRKHFYISTFPRRISWQVRSANKNGDGMTQDIFSAPTILENHTLLPRYVGASCSGFGLRARVPSQAGAEGWSQLGVGLKAHLQEDFWG